MENKIIKTKCPICKEHHNVTVELEDYNKYKSGELIQNAFPYLSMAEREMIITGVCGKCWDKIFPEDE